MEGVRSALSSNVLIEDKFSGLGMLCLDDVVAEVFNAGRHFEVRSAALVREVQALFQPQKTQSYHGVPVLGFLVFYCTLYVRPPSPPLLTAPKPLS